MVKDTKKRLDLVPSQRPSVVSEPTPSVVDVPHQRSAGDSLVEPTRARSVAVRRSVWVGIAAATALAVAAGGAAYSSDQRALAAADAALDAQMRVDHATLAADRDAVVEQAAEQVVVPAAYAASRAAAAAAAQSAVDHANATLAAVPNAGDGPRAALSASSGAVSTALTAPGVSLVSLRSIVAGVAAPEKAAVDAQAAWQAAENARIAAEQAAAAQAAAEAAAAAAARAKAPATTRSSTRAAAPRAAAQAPAAPAAPAATGVPAGGLVCKGSGGSGAGESSVSAIGSAINAYRASLGLSQLGVSRSGSLVAHAITMANAGGIWHSGGDNIVACVSNGSASSMVTAWSHSPSHDAQMRRTDVSSMAVGGASLNGYLFGAVKFS